jgi:hypothetical protein
VRAVTVLSCEDDGRIIYRLLFVSAVGWIGGQIAIVAMTKSPSQHANAGITRRSLAVLVQTDKLQTQQKIAPRQHGSTSPVHGAWRMAHGDTWQLSAVCCCVGLEHVHPA